MFQRGFSTWKIYYRIERHRLWLGTRRVFSLEKIYYRIERYSRGSQMAGLEIQMKIYYRIESEKPLANPAKATNA